MKDCPHPKTCKNSSVTGAGKTGETSYTCAYIHRHGHSRGCHPSKCIELGKYEPLTKRPKAKLIF